MYHILVYKSICLYTRLNIGIKEAPIIVVNPDRNAIVYITNITQGGYPVIAAFDMNAVFDGDSVHKATSIHLQIDVQSMLENLPKTATVYVQNENELEAVGATNNLRGLAANIKFISEIVEQDSEKVKQKNSGRNDVESDFYNAGVKYSDRDSDGRQLSEEQQKYFQNSVVRDSGGNLKTVYHGSPADFNEFSLKHLGTNGTAEGYGFYFTDSKSVAESYARGTEAQRHQGADGRLYEVYLNITKPLSDTEVTMTRAEFKKFLREMQK